MKKATLVVSCMVIALCASAWAVASPASAVEWVEFNCVKVTGGKYTESKCHEKTASGSWERTEEKGLVGTLSFSASGTIDIEDMAAGLTLECSVLEEGVVGPHKAGKMEKLTATSCKTIKGLCGSPNLVAKPWSTELFEVGGQIRDKIQVALEIICFGFVEDGCSGETSVAMSESSSGVDALYDAGSASVSCVLGGASQGLLSGLVTMTVEGGD